jgi:16S rRNA (uracil1498-N3)-methyltransferase
MAKPFEESWFYAPLNAVGDTAVLTAEESFHMQRVLRLKPGQQVIASNGKGRVFLCETSSLRPGNNAKNEEINVSALEIHVEEPAPPRLNMVLSLLQGKDLEVPVEGLCQLNVEAIHLVKTDHTQEFTGQNHDRLMERLRGKSLVALKQAKKPWLTKIHAPVSIREWQKQNSHLPLVLLHPGEDRLPEEFSGSYGVLTGPEGGFSALELEWLQSVARFRMGLGTTRIRGTHAPLFACGKLMGMGF